MIKNITYLILSFLLLSGCVSDKHLIFFTNTTVGVEIASEPEVGNPIKFIVGYKRQEGVIDPMQNDKAHSVIAKLDFGANMAEDNKGTTVNQWFATGVAAENMANNGSIYSALTNTDKESRIIINNLKSEKLNFALLNLMYMKLSGNIADNTASVDIIELKKDLDRLYDDSLLKPFYEIVTKNNKIVINEHKVQNTEESTKNFTHLITYLNKLKEAKEKSELSLKNKIFSESKDIEMLIRTIKVYESSYDDIIEKLETSEYTIKMAKYIEKIFYKVKGD